MRGLGTGPNETTSCCIPRVQPPCVSSGARLKEDAETRLDLIPMIDICGLAVGRQPKTIFGGVRANAPSGEKVSGSGEVYLAKLRRCTLILQCASSVTQQRGRGKCPWTRDCIDLKTVLPCLSRVS